MNRTNSVEPGFSQPLQVTYHQLLQNKTKVEDELYQTQRQLRRKEGEYLKKIAVYEQRIDQLEEQLDEFSQREESTKTMYEKILSALNCQDKSSYNVDLDRLQEMIQGLWKSHHEISPERRHWSSSFKKSFREQQSNVEALEQSLQQVNQEYSAVIIENEQKAGEAKIMSSQIKEMSLKIEKIENEHKSVMQELELMHKASLQEQKQNLEKQHDDKMQQTKIYCDQQKQRVAEVEDLLRQRQSLPKQVVDAQVSDKIILLQKELTEQKSISEKYKKESENAKNESISITKERDVLREQAKECESQMAKARKQHNQNSFSQNEKIKQLKAKVMELEKQMTVKTEEIKQLNAKQTNSLKQQNLQLVDKKQTGNIVPSQTQAKIVSIGLKDQQPMAVEIPKNDKSAIKKQPVVGQNFRVSNRSSLKHQKMSTQPLHITVNADTESSEITIQNPSLLNFEEKACENVQSSKKKQSRNSNIMGHSSMKNVESSNKKPGVVKNLSPRSKHFIDLEDDMNIQHQMRLFSGDRVENQSRPIKSSTERSGNQLHKYLNIQNPPTTSSIENFNSTSRSLNKHLDSRRQNQFNNIVSQERQDSTGRPPLNLNSSQILLTEGEKALISSLEIEQVVRKMLDQMYGDKTPSQKDMSPTPQQRQLQSSQSTLNFSQRKRSNIDESRGYYLQQHKYNSLNQNKSTFTIDKEFLTKLENSLKKLTKSNEKIKQIMREKENFEKECLKLKQKVKILKEEKQGLLLERENIISQNHKMECKLKQAQVILNLEGEQNNTSANFNHNQTYRLSQNGSQKNLHQKHYTTRDISPGNQSNVTLNIIQEHSSDRYKNAPMTCRVNDSYDISLRLNGDNSYIQGGTMRKPMFTSDRSILDQSHISMRKDGRYHQNCAQVSPFSTSEIPQMHKNHSQQSKFNITQAQNQSQSRGKTPTLHINLQQSPGSEVYCIGITSSRDHHIDRAETEESQNCLTSSKNFNRSTTNLMARKQSHQNSIQLMQSHNNGKQLFKYQSNRDTVLMKSPQMPKIVRSINNISGIAEVQKSQNMNLSSIALDSRDKLGVAAPYNYRDKSPQPFTNLDNTQTVSQSVSILRRMNSNKAKDRYYTSGRNQNTQPSVIAECSMNHYYQTRNANVGQAPLNQVVTFEEDEDYLVNQIEEQTFEEDGNTNQNNNDSCINEDRLILKRELAECQSDADENDTDENNVGERYSSKSDVSIKVGKQNLPPKSQRSADNNRVSWKQGDKKIFRKRDEVVSPSDEREDDEESVQYKLLNNSNFIPSMHSRYVNDDISQ